MITFTHKTRFFRRHLRKLSINYRNEKSKNDMPSRLRILFDCIDVLIHRLYRESKLVYFGTVYGIMYIFLKEPIKFTHITQNQSKK